MTERSQRGLFLDMDGTIADSLGAMRYAYSRFLAEHGCTGSAEEFERLNGPSIPEIVLLLKNRYKLTPPVQTLTEQYDRLIFNVYEGVLPMPGTSQVLSAAKSRGWSVAVVTSSSCVIACRWLSKNALKAYIDTVVGREQVSRGKPHPDLYVKALQETGCAADRSIAVEDSVQGIRAASRAGIRTYLLSTQPQVICEESAGVIGGLHVVAEWIAGGRFDV